VSAGPPDARRERLLRLGVASAALLCALFFHDKGIVVAEEGMIAAEAEEIRGGAVMYRDIPTLVSPGAWYTAALTFAVFGPDLNAARLVMAVLFAATAVAVHALGRTVAPAGWALGGVALLLVQKVLVFPLGTFLFYTEFAVFFALLCAYGLLRRSLGGGVGWLALAGLSLGLCGLFKQNIAAALGLSVLVFAWQEVRGPRTLAWLFAPPLALGAAVALAFAWAGALGDAVHAMVVLPFTAFRDPNRIAYLEVFGLAKDAAQKFHYFPALFGAEFLFPPRRGAPLLVPFVNAGVMAVYAAPAALLAWTGLRAVRRRPRKRLRGAEIALLAGAVGPLFGAYPRSDFPHVAQALVGFVPLAVYLAATSRHARVWRWTGGALALAGAAFAALLVWRMPYDQRFEHPRARLDLTTVSHQVVTALLETVEREVPEDELVAFLPAGAVYYFLTGRPVPWGFTLVIPHAVGHDGGASLVDAFERHGVRWVVRSRTLMPGLPPLEAFAPVLAAWLDERFEARAPGDPRLRGVRILERRGDDVDSASRRRLGSKFRPGPGRAEQ